MKDAAEPCRQFPLEEVTNDGYRGQPRGALTSDTFSVCKYAAHDSRTAIWYQDFALHALSVDARDATDCDTRSSSEILFFITPRIYRPDYQGKPTNGTVGTGQRTTTISQPVPLGNPPSNTPTPTQLQQQPQTAPGGLMPAPSAMPGTPNVPAPAVLIVLFSTVTLRITVPTSVI